MISRNLKLLLLLIAMGTISAYVVLVIIPSQLAKRSYEAAKTIGEEFRKAFQFSPEITVNNTIVLNQQTPIFELAVLSQNYEHRYSWENTWMNSTKQIAIAGTFEAKVGFDLHEKFSIVLTDADQAIVTLPQPKILSVESQGDIGYTDENGIWNWVSDEDRVRATNAFISDARKKAEQTKFIQDCKEKMEDQIRMLLKPYAKEVVIRYDTIIKTNQDR